MTDTKEKILQTALALFAENGYEAVSVSRIAGELGMTKGALYKHYQNKRDIFDHIVQRLFDLDARQSAQCGVPEEKFEEDPESYRGMTAEKLTEFTAAQFVFWTEDSFASKVRKMLTLEQYRDTDMAKLFADCFTDGPVSYTADIFREMMAQGTLKKADPRQLAIEFYAPFGLLIGLFDRLDDKQEALSRLKRHMEHFFEQNTEKGEHNHEIHSQ